MGGGDGKAGQTEGKDDGQDFRSRQSGHDAGWIGLGSTKAKSVCKVDNRRQMNGVCQRRGQAGDDDGQKGDGAACEPEEWTQPNEDEQMEMDNKEG